MAYVPLGLGVTLYGKPDALCASTMRFEAEMPPAIVTFPVMPTPTGADRSEKLMLGVVAPCVTAIGVPDVITQPWHVMPLNT